MLQEQGTPQGLNIHKQTSCGSTSQSEAPIFSGSAARHHTNALSSTAQLAMHVPSWNLKNHRWLPALTKEVRFKACVTETPAKLLNLPEQNNIVLLL